VVWPTVFRLLDRRDAAFGLTARANGNATKMRRALDREITTTGTARALCSGTDQTQCLKDAEFLTGRRWTAMTDNCAEKCSVIETSEQRDR